MDRNTIIGFVLIALLLVLYSIYSKPSKEEIEKAQRERDSLKQVEMLRQEQLDQQFDQEAKVEKPKEIVKEDEKEQEELKSIYGGFASAVNGEMAFNVIENDLMRVKISNKGGRVYSVELKDYQTYRGDPLILFDGDSTVFGFNFYANNRSIFTNDLYFVPQTEQKVIDASYETNSFKTRLYAGEDSYIEYTYTLTPGSYLVDYDIRFVNMENIIAGNQSFIDLQWSYYSPQQEKGAKNEEMYTTISYKYFQDEVSTMRSRGKDDSEEDINNRLKWLAFKQQFFSTILVAGEHMSNAAVRFEPVPDNDKYLKKFSAEIGIPFNPTSTSVIPFEFYYGPNHFQTLKKFEYSFEELVPLGWGIFGWVNRYFVIPVFNWLDNFIQSYGLIILILTILIKIILFPLTYKSYLSTAKMRVLKPEIDEVNKKFPKKEDAMKKQQATMALYKKAGVNPMGGCIPILIQFPILIAMFRFFPASFELRQKSFLWADDLSSYDSILDLPFNIWQYGDHVSLFTLLMAVALFFTTRINSGQMADTSQQMPGMKFMMNYMMPVMLLVFFNNYAAGLSYYYFLSNVITLAQTVGIRRFVDEDAILKKLHENKKKPVKKSKWQKRLEEAAKQKGYKPKK